MKIFKLTMCLLTAWTILSPTLAHSEEFYSFYNYYGENLSDIGLSEEKMQLAFETFYEKEEPEFFITKDRFYATMFKDGSYGFLLYSSHNCGSAGCGTYAAKFEGSKIVEPYSLPLYPIDCGVEKEGITKCYEVKIGR